MGFRQAHAFRMRTGDRVGDLGGSIPQRRTRTMSALFRNKGWLTVAQLVSSWAPELAAKTNPARAEHDLMQVLIEDIVNGRLDDAGPLTDGRRLGLRIITPEGQAGFIEGHQVRDLIVPGGITSFVTNRLVVLKDAVLDFARRHELPPPSWWADAANESNSTNDTATDAAAPILGTVSQTPRAATRVRARGQRAKKLEQVKEAMRNDVRQGRHTLAELQGMLEKNMALTYGVSRDTARKAPNAILSELSELSPDK
jgi:hypothetical protein